jgi:hypothetical protein
LTKSYRCTTALMTVALAVGGATAVADGGRRHDGGRNHGDGGAGPTPLHDGTNQVANTGGAP